MDWRTLRSEQLGEYRGSGLPRWLTVPVFPTAVAEFSQKAEDPDVSAAELGRIIETDNGLTCELLRNVNGSAVGLRHKATTAQHAISVLGIYRSKLTLLNAAAQRAMQPSNLDTFDCEAFAFANLQRALFAQQLARCLGTDQDLAFAAALLCDCVLPTLAAHDSEFYSAHRDELSPKSQSLAQHELHRFEYCHTCTAAQLALAWKFPDDLICCILLHHAPLRKLIELGLNGSPVVAVRLAALLPDWFNQEPQGLSTMFWIEKHFPTIDLAAIAEQVDTQTAQLHSDWDRANGISALIHSHADSNS